ncbi:MAG: zf-HC2 domain-containing protein [Chloroflexi bacterium]|nr:zf-HC2 domain-containing protein [Chloroflexota bacterium]
MATLSDADLDLLSAYLDGMLPADERARVEQRLEHEPALRAACADLRRIITALHELPALQPRRSLAVDAAHPRIRRALPWRWLRPLQYAGSLALVIMAVLGVTLAGVPANQSPLAMNLAAPALPAAEEATAEGGAPFAAAAPADDAARSRSTEQAPAGDAVAGAAPPADGSGELLAGGAQVAPRAADPPVMTHLGLGLAGLIALAALVATTMRAILVRSR